MTYDRTCDEAEPLPDGDEDGATERVLVDGELVEPSTDVTGSKEPDDSA